VNIIVGNAWPYTNGSLHIGRIAALLPGDVLARYHRLMGDKVVFISGSDCHGTPVTMKAAEEGLSPQETVSKYHEELKECFKKFDFSYDYFSKTHSKYHMEKVKEIILELYNKGYIYEKEVNQIICSGTEEILLDNYIDEKCSHCEKSMQGLCKKCGQIYEIGDEICEKCEFCTGNLEIKRTKQLFFALSKLENDVKRLFIRESNWRKNAVEITKRYLDEGLKDRVLTRDFNWGIDVPFDGYTHKKIYVWIEAVMGYLSASMEYLEKINEDYRTYWEGEESKIYLVHEKENIPFHTVILPGILAGIGIKNPNIQIISSEKLRLEGKQFSIAKNWVVWAEYLVNNYNVDSIRYYLIMNGPEENYGDFKWKEFINENNNTLVNIVGNFVNRVLLFIVNNFHGHIPKCKINKETENKILQLYFRVGDKIEEGKFKDGLSIIINEIKIQNDLFNINKPWVTINENKKKCEEDIYVSLQYIVNFANLIEPYMPETAKKIRKYLKIDKSIWSYIEKKDGKIEKVELLFENINKDNILKEVNKLRKNKKNPRTSV